MVNLLNPLTDPVIGATIACALALLFTLAAVHKLRAPDVFRATLAAYAILPSCLNGVAVRLLPWLELTTAIALLHPQTRAYAAFAAATLLGLYGVVIGMTMAAGRQIADCGCNFGEDKQSVQWALVWRNFVLALIALGLALIELVIQRAPDLRALSTYDTFTIVLGVMFASAAYALTNTLIANHYRLQELLHD